MSAVSVAALSWCGTPYHHNAAIKGVGVDCGQILIEIFLEAGHLRARPDAGQYSYTWMLHRDDDRYLEMVEKFAEEIPDPEDDCIAVWKFGRTYSHGAVVIGWPQIVHSHRGEGAHIDTAERFSGRPVKFYRVRKQWAD